MINKPSARVRKQILLLKKVMSKEAHTEYCHKCRSFLILGRNYGTRRTPFSWNYVRKRIVNIAPKIINDFKYLIHPSV